MKTLLISFLLLVSILGFGQRQPLVQPTTASDTAMTETRQVISYVIIGVFNQTFGYDIFVDGKLKIHQPTIPCYSGVEGFKRRVDAERVAQLVVGKMKKGEMPPTVTKDEMKNLGVSVSQQ